MWKIEPRKNTVDALDNNMFVEKHYRNYLGDLVIILMN